MNNDNFLCKSHQCKAFTQCLSTFQKQNSGSPFIYQDPLQGNSHWFPYVYIKTLYEAMIIYFLSLHQGPLRGNGHRFPYIKTLCKAMVIDFLCQIEALYEAIVIDFLCHIEDLCKAMVIDLFTSRPFVRQWWLISYVTLRPSTRQWSSISLHQHPLRGNGDWFLMSHRGPLRGNGHRSPYIKTLCEAMVIDFFCQIVTLYMVMVTEYFE